MSIWVVIAVIIIAALLAVALQPKPQKPKPAALDEFDFPTADDGRPMCVLFGTNWSNDANVLWYGDLSTSAIKSKSK